MVSWPQLAFFLSVWVRFSIVLALYPGLVKLLRYKELWLLVSITGTLSGTSLFNLFYPNHPGRLWTEIRPRAPGQVGISTLLVLFLGQLLKLQNSPLLLSLVKFSLRCGFGKCLTKIKTHRVSLCQAERAWDLGGLTSLVPVCLNEWMNEWTDGWMYFWVLYLSFPAVTLRRLLTSHLFTQQIFIDCLLGSRH